MAGKAFPQNPDGWRAAIEDGLKISDSLLQAAYNRGEFPKEALEAWIRETYKQGYNPDFVPALVRNLHGLVDWVYGGADEPYWPGSDKTKN